jgi:hypothetical protein
MPSRASASTTRSTSSLAVRLQPAGDHHLRLDLRRYPWTDVRHHGVRLLPREEAADRPERPQHHEPVGLLYYEGGWNNRALVALAGSGVVSIGLAMLGAYAVIPNVGDWGWLIGAALGAVLYVALMSRAPVTMRGAQPAE